MFEGTLQPETLPIEHVTVYLRGAQVQRSGTAHIPEGESRLTVERLPAGMLGESIQASLGEGAEILSVEHRLNHLVEAAYDQDIQKLRDDLEKLRDEKKQKEALIEVCSCQEEMLEANRNMAGSHTGLKAEELKEGVRFLRECMEDIKTRQLVLEKEVYELERKIFRVEGQLGYMNEKSSQPVSEIVLRILSQTGGDIPLHLSYFVNNAGWVPTYDVRAKDIQSPIRLSCKAKISQSTNEEWENVKLTISTGSPSGNAVCPELTPWHLDFQRPAGWGKSGMYQSFNAAKVRRSSEPLSEMRQMDMEMDESMERGGPMAAAVPPPQPVGASVDQGLTSVEYTIPTPCTILSGQGEQMVEMVAHQVPARYQYLSVRKLDKEVYLLAKVGDYARLNLVAGEANIFFANKYVGKSFIDPRKGDEEIDWSLGADKSVVVTRHKGKSFTANALGGNVKVTREWELTVRNLKEQPISVQLQDQVPVSANKQIQVEPTELSGAEMDKDTGILKWELELEPSGSKTLRVRYVVLYPKSSSVLLD